MGILNKLTITHLKMNKRRTVVTIIGIVLSTALMVGIGLLLSTFRENAIDTVVANTGDYHVAFYNLNEEQYNTIKDNKSIKKTLLTEKIGYSFFNNNEAIYTLKVLGVKNDYLNELKIVSGRLPQNENEIVLSNDINADKLNKKITLNIGIRYNGVEEAPDNEMLIEEQIINTTEKEYTVVGTFEHDSYFSYRDAGIPAYTLTKNIDNNINIYVTYKNPKVTYDETDNLVNKLSLNSETQVSTNIELLALSGSSRYSNFMGAMIGTLTIVLVILSIGCIIVIYNSFAISVIERKKQFGLLSSIGATRKQIRKTVLFEAVTVGTIGIILGIASAYLGIGVVTAIINKLLPDIFEAPLRLATYRIFIVIPIIFMVITVFISAFIPAYKASKISPIKAIRLNDDIKIKGKKVKTPKYIRKTFGEEGEIALKNIKRNKKKYRITILSLFISIVLFISFSGYMEYMFSGVDSYSSIPSFDGGVTIDVTADQSNTPAVKGFANDVINGKGVKEGIFINQYELETKTILNKDNYNPKVYNLWQKNIDNREEYGNLVIVEVTSEKFNQLLKSMNKTEVKPILYNSYKGIKYSNNSRKVYELDKYSKDLSISFEICRNLYDEEQTRTCEHEINDYYLGSPKLFADDYLKDSFEPILIVPVNYLEYLPEIHNGYNSYIFLGISNNEALETNLENLSSKYNISYDYMNIAEQYQLIRNLIFCVKLLIYGFITLVTLIGVTSVFNTINTSIHLRRREFAVLRSMGLSNHGFNKMLFFESIFFCIKSLLYALPVSMGVVVLLHQSFQSMTETDTYIIPYNSIIIAVIGVFFIIMITTIYSTRKIRHENILDAIREENI